MRSATLLLIRMKAAETSASSAIADWTPLTVVSRSWTTAEIETFIRDVSTTRTNIAAASSRANRELGGACSGTGMLASLVTGPPSAASEQVLALPPHPPRCGTAVPHPVGVGSGPTPRSRLGGRPRPCAGRGSSPPDEGAGRSDRQAGDRPDPGDQDIVMATWRTPATLRGSAPDGRR